MAPGSGLALATLLIPVCWHGHTRAFFRDQLTWLCQEPTQVAFKIQFQRPY